MHEADREPPCEDAHVAVYDWTSSEPSTAVVEVTAQARGLSPESLPPLYDTVDPDALNMLVDGGGDLRLTFTYDGHDVTLDGDGTVTVRETP